MAGAAAVEPARLQSTLQQVHAPLSFSGCENMKIIWRLHATYMHRVHALKANTSVAAVSAVEDTLLEHR